MLVYQRVPNESWPIPTFKSGLKASMELPWSKYLKIISLKKKTTIVSLQHVKIIRCSPKFFTSNCIFSPKHFSQSYLFRKNLDHLFPSFPPIPAQCSLSQVVPACVVAPEGRTQEVAETLTRPWIEDGIKIWHGFLSHTLWWCQNSYWKWP